MRFDLETPPSRRRSDRAGGEGDVNGMLGAAAWARRQADLSRWALREAALVQLSLAVLAWVFVARLIRWSLGW